MEDKELLDKIISLTENVIKLKLENERLKEELKHERELNKFRAGFPHQFVTDEYVRKDAFIEKASEWFKIRYEWIDIDGTRNYDKSAFEDFKNYMKGE
jgi:regulator of replication initiation timing